MDTETKPNGTAEANVVRVPAQAMSELRELKAQMNGQLRGMRQMANVPDQWLFDWQRGAFVPPQNGKAKQDGNAKEEA